MRTSVKSLLALAVFSASVPAFAQDEQSEDASGITLSANVALTSDYRFRGFGFSDGDIAVQGGFDIGHESGLYAGVWASSIEDSPVFGHTEVDLYAGYKTEIADGVTVDAGLLYYLYPNGDNSAVLPTTPPTTVALNSDFFESYSKISGTLGPASITVGAAYAWDQKALAGDNLYLYTDASVGIPNTPVTLNGHVGYNDGSLSLSTDDDYTDYSIGAAYAVNSNLTASVNYVSTETDLPSVDGLTDDAVVFTLKAAF